MVNFVRQATKKSLLSFLKNPKEADSREWRRLFDALLFKDELESYLDGGGTSTGGSSGSTSSPLGAFLKKDGSTKLTSDWDAGSQKIRAKTLQSDVPTGTAPLTVASTTLVDNLNADTVDGVEESAFVLVDGTRNITGNFTMEGITTIEDNLIMGESDGSAVACAFRTGAATFQEFAEWDTADLFLGNAGVDTKIRGDSVSTSANLTVGGTGDLYVDSSTNPTLFLREDGSGTNYARIMDNGSNYLYIDKTTASGLASLRFNPLVSDNSSNISAIWFRDTNTSGSRLFTLFQGDGSATKAHELNAGTGDVNLCQQAGQTTIGGTGGSEKLTVVGDASFGDKGVTNYVKVDSDKLLSFQGTADIAAAVDQKIVFRSYIDVKARNGEYSLHGGINALDTAHDLGAGDLVVTCGTGKIMLSINAGADVVGDITITGTTVDRDTGAETGADTDVLTIDAVTTDNSSTDASGNAIHEFVGAYITSKWFKGSITITSADTDVTDMDTYQVAFDQMDDSPGITLKTFDITATATNTAAWLYAYLYTLHVTGDKCNVDTESSIDLPAAEVTANMTYRLRRGEINESFSGATDGFWVEMFPGPLANTYWENINVQVYANIKRDVYGESS